MSSERETKRKPEILADGAKMVVKRKYNMDVDILECPICWERFSPPVYQCPNGHTICSACFKNLKSSKCPTCQLPTGSIRCIAVEKMIDALLVRCRYTELGCTEMLNECDTEEHESLLCDYEPFRCPYSNCDHEGSRVTSSLHLNNEHKVRTVSLNRISGAGFTMEFSDSFVIVKEENDCETPLQFLIYRQVHEALDADVFFCARFGNGDYNRYNLNLVETSLYPSVRLSVAGAIAQDLRNMDDFWKDDFLLLPRKALPVDSGEVELHFSLYRD